MEVVIIDTSIIIDYLRGRSQLLLKLLEHQKDKKIKLLLPVVALLELEVSSSMENLSTHERVLNLLSPIERVEVDEECSVLAGQFIRRKNVTTDPIDALIAAITVIHNAELTTLNIKHFKNAPNLNFYK